MFVLHNAQRNALKVLSFVGNDGESNEMIAKLCRLFERIIAAKPSQTSNGLKDTCLLGSGGGDFLLLH